MGQFTIDTRPTAQATSRYRSGIGIHLQLSACDAWSLTMLAVVREREATRMSSDVTCDRFLMTTKRSDNSDVNIEEDIM